MQYKTITLLALAAGAVAAPEKRQATASYDTLSLLSVLETALPSSVLAAALTNSASLYSEVASEFAAGSTPGWYSSLPADVKSLFGGEAASTAAASTGPLYTSANATAATATGTAATASYTGNSTIGSNSTIRSSSSGSSTGTTTRTSASSSGSSSGSSSSSSSSGAASVPTGIYGLGLAGAVGLVGVLAL